MRCMQLRPPHCRGHCASPRAHAAAAGNGVWARNDKGKTRTGLRKGNSRKAAFEPFCAPGKVGPGLLQGVRVARLLRLGDCCVEAHVALCAQQGWLSRADGRAGTGAVWRAGGRASSLIPYEAQHDGSDSSCLQYLEPNT